MKKKLILAIVITTILCCLFAIGISAAEPDTTKETVTLDDGTVCALWDTDGNPLIWYITATDVEGVKTYAYVDATSEAVAYINSSNSTNQLDNITITVDGTEYAKSTIAVANFPNAKITAVSGNGKDARIGEDAIRLYKTFQSCTNLEYAYVNLATTSVGQETFKSCSNLKFVNIAELTELTSIGIQSFNSCAKLFDGISLDLTSTKLKEIGNLAFYKAKFVSVKVPEATFTTLGSEVFRECTKLETVIGTKNAFAGMTSIGGYSYRECNKLKQLDGLIENGILIIPEGVTSVGTFAFTNCDAIEYIEFPSTLTFIGQQGFSYMDNVKLIDFGKITGTLSLNNCGHFRGLKNLVAASLPEGMIEVNNRAFADCSSLTAFYMPNSIQKLSTNGQQQGSFCNSTKMYFVQKSFTVGQCLVDGKVDVSKLDLPEKPEIYYMPTSLQTFSGWTYTNDQYSNGSIFANCISLNDVLVFPESFTSMITMRPFMNVGTASSPKTIVFTGNIESFVLSHQATYVTFVFANANDKGFEDLGIKRTTGNSNEKGSYAYFCSTGKKYELAVSGRQGSGQDPTTEESIAKIAATIEALNATKTDGTYHVHDKNKDKTSEATCTLPAGEFTYCFCGTLMTSEIAEGSVALGHLESETFILYYPLLNDLPNYFANVIESHSCEREGCGATIEKTRENSALFIAKGMTVPDYGISALCHAIQINLDAVEDYNAFLGEGNEIKYGVLAGVAVDGNKPVGADGKSNCDAIVMGFEATKFSIIQLKLTGLEKANKQLYCGAYVVVDGVVSYLYEGAVSDVATPLTVNNGILDQTTPETTVEETKEN